MVVDAPAGAGRLRLRVTLVQEHVTWFTQLPTPVFDDVSIAVVDARRGWTLGDVADLCDLAVLRDAPVATLGFVSSPFPGMLTFATTNSLVDSAVRGGCHALIVPPVLVLHVPDDIGVIESDTPAQALGSARSPRGGTDFYGADVESRVHPGAGFMRPPLSTHNVRIADGVVVGGGV
jgi:hypothetical protein